MIIVTQCTRYCVLQDGIIEQHYGLSMYMIGISSIRDNHKHPSSSKTCANSFNITDMAGVIYTTAN